MRDRPVENKWIGQRIADPDIDLAAIGRAQGTLAWGPIVRLADLAPALEAAIEATIAGRVAVVDVRVQPGYTPAMTVATAPTAPRRARGNMNPASTPSGDEIATQVFPLLDVANITKRFQTADGETIAVDGMSFSVAAGEFVSIIGPSGCGKSTVFNIIGGLVGDYEGKVRVAGDVVSGTHPAIGMVFQEESTFPWRNVLENVAFPSKSQVCRNRSAWTRQRI
jgi:ABC-type glutathione transport system ATPase component